MTALVWFRHDYRIDDHTPLSNACAHHEQVVAVVFDCPQQWQQHHYSRRRQELVTDAIHELSRNLTTLNIPLITIETPTFDEVALKDYRRKKEQEAVVKN